MIFLKYKKNRRHPTEVECRLFALFLFSFSDNSPGNECDGYRK